MNKQGLERNKPKCAPIRQCERDTQELSIDLAGLEVRRVRFSREPVDAMGLQFCLGEP